MPGPQVVALESGELLCVAASDDGRWLAAGSSNDRLRVFDAASLELLGEARGHRRGITEVAFRADGARIATAGPDRTVRLWSREPLEELLVLRGPERPVNRLAFSSGGTLAAVSMAGEIWSWDAESGEPLLDKPGPSLRGVSALAMARDGGHVAWAGDGGNLRLWSSVDGSKVAGMRIDALGIVAALALSDDARRAVTAVIDGDALAVWSLDGALTARCSGVAQGVLSVAFDRAGDRVASCTRSGVLQVWDARSGAELARWESGGAVLNTVDFGPLGRLFAVGTTGLLAWDVSGLRGVALERGAPLDAPVMGSQAAQSLPFDPDAPLDLAYLAIPDYDPPELRGADGPLDLGDFPAPVRALAGKEVTARGFPIAAELKRGVVTHFLLSRFPPGCCFGSVPVLDEWISVTPPAGLGALDATRAVDVVGVLEVGELIDEDGFAVSLYRMRATAVR